MSKDRLLNHAKVSPKACCVKKTFFYALRYIASGLSLLLYLMFTTTVANARSVTVPASPSNFITTWAVPVDGSDVSRTITFPGTGTYDIDWGDGMAETATGVAGVSGFPNHTYATDTIARTYTITVTRTITRFNLNNGADKEKLTNVAQWGTARWASMAGAFYGATNMNITASDAPDLSVVTNMRGMFTGASTFNADISRWDVSKVTDMFGMFANATAFNADITRWNVSAVMTMSGMFFRATAFNADISRWDVSKVTDMFGMFANATAFNQNLAEWYIQTTPVRNYNGTTNLNVLTIAAQNSVLSRQSPSYALVAGEGAADNGKFSISGNTLAINTANIPANDAGTYTVRIQASSSSLFGADPASRAIQVMVIGIDTAPAFGNVVADQIYIVDTAVNFTLPQASGGNGALTYILAPDLPVGLSFNADMRIISGNPSAVAESTNYTYTASDVDDNTDSSDTITLGFTITVKSGAITAERVRQLNEAIMPRLTQAVLTSALASVSSRINTAFSDAAPSTSYRLDGLTLGAESIVLASFLQKLPDYVQSLDNGTINWRRMLANSSFALSRQKTGDAANGLSIWGSGGDYSNLGGGNDATRLGWSGKVFSVQLGVDKRIHNNLLAGGLVSWGNSDVAVDLVGASGQGSYRHRMISIHPYLAWSSGNTQLWGSLGYGKGELEIDLRNDTLSTSTRLVSLAAGAETRLSRKLSLKSDVSLARTDIDKTDDSDEQGTDSQRLRLLLKTDLFSYRLYTSTLKMGLRYDGGDGDSGFGAVVDTSIVYINPANNLTMEARLHTLLGRDNYTEWGISGLMALSAAGNNRGLAFSLIPSYSNSLAASTQAIWQQNQANHSAGHSRGANHQIQLDTRLSYGLLAPNGRGLLSPYSEMSFGRASSYRLGVRWQRNDRFDLNLFGERKQSNSRPIDHAILLESTVRF